MNALLPIHSTKPTEGPLLVFEPVTVRAGGFWRVVNAARTALLVWGGISLAGVAAASAIYASGSLGPYLQAEAEPIPSLHALTPLQPQAPAQPAKPVASVPVEAQQGAAPADKPQGLAALAVKPAVDPAPVTSSASGPATLGMAPSASAPPPAGMFALGPAPGAPPAIARLPRARPDQEVIASIERQYAYPRRFRTLRELQRYYAFADPYVPPRSHRVYRRQPRVYYRW